MVILKRDETSESTFEIERHRRRVESQLAKVECALCIHFPRITLAGQAQVENGNAETLYKIRLLTHVAHNSVPVELSLGEYGGIRLEHDDGPIEFRGADFLRLPDRFATIFVLLDMSAAVAMHLSKYFGRKRVDDGYTDPVQTARDFVPFASEFTPGVEHCHHCLERRDFCFRMDLDGNASAIVGDTYEIVGQKRYLDVVAKSTHRFVARIVEDLPDEMVQTGWTGRADVHSWPPSHRFETFEDGNVRGSVGALFCRLFGSTFCLSCSHVLVLPV